MATGGTMSVVRLWNIQFRGRSVELGCSPFPLPRPVPLDVARDSLGGCSKIEGLKLVDTLLGHSDTVSCLDVCEAFHLLASGSQDGTCILWDLCNRTHLRTLSVEGDEVSQVSISRVTVCRGFFPLSLPPHFARQGLTCLSLVGTTMWVGCILRAMWSPSVHVPWTTAPVWSCGP